MKNNEIKIKCNLLNYCDQFKRIMKIIFIPTSANRAKNIGLFKATHYPMTLYLKDEEKINSNENKTISENDILKNIKNNLIINSYPRRKIIYFIQGDTGTGKSELIMYLQSEIEKISNVYIISIKKDQSWFQISSKTLPEEYKKLFNEELPQPEGLIKFRNSNPNKNKIEQLSSNFALKILNFLRKENIIEDESKKPDDSSYDELEKAKPIRDHLKKYLENYIFEKYNDNEDISKRYYIFEPEHIPKFKLTLIKNINHNDIALEMEKGLQMAIKEEFGIMEINDLLLAFNKKIQEIDSFYEKPLLFIFFEDFALRGEDLKNFQNFISEDSYDLFNFIIAGTEDKIRQFDDNTIKARATFYYTTLPGNYTTPFLSEENVDEFLSKYLNYFKRKLKICSECLYSCIDKIYTKSNLKLFPFNSTFLKRLYLNLDRKNKQPRRFLKEIETILIQFIDEKTPPYIHASEKYRYNINYGISDKSLKTISNTDESEFLKWYAVEDKNGKLFYDKIIARSFGLNLTSYKNLKHTFRPPQALNIGLEKSQKLIKKEKSKESPYQKILNDKLEALISDLFRWKKNPADFTDINIQKYMKSGFQWLLNEITNNLTIFKSFKIYSGNPLDELIFYNGNSRQEYKEMKFLNKFNGINLNDFNDDILKIIIKIGILNYDISDFSKEFVDRSLNDFKNKLITTNYDLLFHYKNILEKTLMNVIIDGIINIIFKKDYIRATSNPYLSFVQILYVIGLIQIFLKNPLLDLNYSQNFINYVLNPNKLPINKNIRLNVELSEFKKFTDYFDTISKCLKILINENGLPEIKTSLNQLLNESVDNLIGTFYNNIKVGTSKYGIINNVKIFNIHLKDFLNDIKTFISVVKKQNEDLYQNDNFQKDLDKKYELLIQEIYELCNIDKKKYFNFLKGNSELEQHESIKVEINKFNREFNDDNLNIFKNINISTDNSSSVNRNLKINTPIIYILKNVIPSNPFVNLFIKNEIIRKISDLEIIKAYRALKDKLINIEYISTNFDPLFEIPEILDYD
ncbi:MAG: hypothetical protein ACTSPY_03980 [Candidatus Helarchaeota archaeon]